MQETIAETTTKASNQLGTELQDRLLSDMDWIGETAKAGVDLAGREPPLLLREIAVYGAVSNWLYCFIAVIPIVLFCFYIRNKNKEPYVKEGHYNDSPTPRLFKTVVLGLLTFIGSSAFGIHIDDAIKATFAPRVYVIEWSATQVKKITNSR